MISKGEQWDALTQGENEEARRHIRRYEWAASYTRALHVIDAACGMGYGASILHPFRYLGVDRNEEAVTYAQDTYGSYGTFLCADLEQNTLEGFDAVVSFETIEHLQDPRTWLLRLAPKLLLGSVPVYPTSQANPYHLHDFTEESIQLILREAGYTVAEFFVESLNSTESPAPTAVFRAYRP